MEDDTDENDIVWEEGVDAEEEKEVEVEVEVAAYEEVDEHAMMDVAAFEEVCGEESSANDEGSAEDESVPGVEQDLESEKSVVNTDDSFSISCAFRAKPAASVAWKRDDDSALSSDIFSSTLINEVGDGKFTITTSTVTWNSESDSTERRGQGGKMLCEADNGIRDPVKSNTMDLTIQYAPYGLTIAPGSSSVELNEGDTLPDRVCSANCEPSCSYTWHFNGEDGNVVENSDTLSMQNVQRGKHGSYFCKASNEIHPSAHDNFALIVNYGPEIQEFKTTPQDGSIIESNSTTFSCSVDTQPGTSIRLTGPQGLSESVEAGNELEHTIDNIGCIHSGTYTCTSNNPKTRIDVDKTIDIPVKCSPSMQTVIPEDRIYGVTEQASVYFFVEALSHPTPDFQWKRTFNNGTSVNLPSEDSGNKSNLTISNIKIKDFGYYTVSAQNIIGRWEDVEFELRALVFPSFKVNCITIEGDQALIKWTLDKDLVDRVLVRTAGITKNENFVETNVTDFDQDQVVVGLPSASSFILDFSVYKRDDLLVSQSNVQHLIAIGDDSTDPGMIIGVVAGLLVLIALCVVAFFVTQKFRKPKSRQSTLAFRSFADHLQGGGFHYTAIRRIRNEVPSQPSTNASMEVQEADEWIRAVMDELLLSDACQHREVSLVYFSIAFVSQSMEAVHLGHLISSDSKLPPIRSAEDLTRRTNILATNILSM
ncbi:hypothetical protein CAPTEDRAFT_191124 [Capitella teleta]|uniref:Ig-like domain-containing protein n=1 Tax=Capitella teleta TaxID=283909 RepID=R7UQ29_CAPTE|nr:hypothetical protein CAPTEDRAFT_191124 [Capitella teleta]|eukprot:ELU08609.1 hypothetical protein CAPTEDRAFT_191124 [Capitella teleta]